MIITTLPTAFIEKVYAYQNNSYFNDLKIGLITMSAPSISITLNGAYTINGQAYLSGTTLNLVVSGTSITLNGSLQTQINIVPNDKANLLTISSGTLSNKYMGSFLIKSFNSKVLPINILDMENYLKGVVGYEMSDYFPLEALKAQTVAARNYALTRIGWESAKGYDFDDTINYQVYKGYNAAYSKVITAVEQTKGQVLLYNDKLVETLYSAWHGGVSENSENVWGNVVPYLKSVTDSYENDPWPNGNRVLNNAQIQSMLITKGYLASTDTFLQLDLTSITKFTSGRVSNINIIYKNSAGHTQTKSITKDNTRTFLSLPSNLYNVTYDAISGTYTFSGKGNGHGLGMSQIGAKNRAAAGQSFEDILKFYFQNTYIQNLIVKATLNTMTQSSNELFVGNTISLNSTAASGNGYGYLYKYVIKNGANIVLTKDYSSTSTLDFIPSNAGNYTVEAYVKDKFSTSDYDDRKFSSFTAYDSLTFTSFTKDVENIFLGDTVNFSSTVVGGSNKGTKYKYVVTKDGAIIFNGDFSTTSNFSYVPTSIGNFQIEVYGIDAISTKNYDAVSKMNFLVETRSSIDTLTIDKTSSFISDTVTLNTTSNIKDALYKYTISVNGEIIFTSNYDFNSSLQYIPTRSGNYEVTVFTKNPLSLKEYDDTKTLTFVVFSDVKINALNSNKSEYLINETINFNTTSSLGSGSYLYKYEILNNGIVVFSTDYSNIETLEYTTKTPGIYTINAYMKDLFSSKVYDDMATLTISVYSPELANVSVSGYFYEGKELTFNTNATGTSPTGFSYKYEIYNNDTLIVSNNFNDLSILTFTPTIPGNYMVKVYGKDGLSTNSYDCTKQFNITVNSKPLYLSTLPLSLKMTNSNVTALQNALIKLGYNIPKVSNYFGTETKTAVVSFQKSRGLVADGIVGNMTYSALNNALIELAGIKKLTY
jgi:stage II sporulation protein D